MRLSHMATGRDIRQCWALAVMRVPCSPLAVICLFLPTGHNYFTRWSLAMRDCPPFATVRKRRWPTLTISREVSVKSCGERFRVAS